MTRPLSTNRRQYLPIPHLTPQELKKFWDRVERRADGLCWLWRGERTADGRGKLYIRGKRLFASRLAWSIANGRPIANDKAACHECDNPQCVNPSHIWPGTDQDNAIDRERKGRHPNSRKTHCKRGHEFTPENTAIYGGGRQCRECWRMHSRKSNEKRRRASR